MVVAAALLHTDRGPEAAALLDATLNWALVEAEMIACADDLDFERAALLRDQVAALRRGDTDVPSRTPAGAPGTRPRLKRRRRS